jgi:hypothetical protein
MNLCGRVSRRLLIERPRDTEAENIGLQPAFGVEIEEKIVEALAKRTSRARPWPRRYCR